MPTTPTTMMGGFVNVSAKAPIRKATGPPSMEPPPIISMPKVPPVPKKEAEQDSPPALIPENDKPSQPPHQGESNPGGLGVPHPTRPQDDADYVREFLHGAPLKERAFDDSNMVSSMGARLTDCGSDKHSLEKWSRQAPQWKKYHTRDPNYPSDSWLFPAATLPKEEAVVVAPKTKQDEKVADNLPADLDMETMTFEQFVKLYTLFSRMKREAVQQKKNSA